jgi:hypothetical protein
MCWNQPARVDYLCKKWRAAQKKILKKGAGQPYPGVDPRLAGDRWSPAGPRPTTGDRRPLVRAGSQPGDHPRPLVAGIPATSSRRPQVIGPGPTGDQRSPTGRGSTPRQGRPGPFFLNFFIILMLPPTLWSIFYWKFGEWARAFGRMGAHYTHFFKLPPSLGSVKSSIPHRVWRFSFHGKLKSLKIPQVLLV